MASANRREVLVRDGKLDVTSDGQRGVNHQRPSIHAAPLADGVTLPALLAAV